MKKISNNKRLHILVVLLCCLFPLIAQDRNDLGLWLNADLDVKWHPKWQSTFVAEFRARENVSAVDLYSGGIFVNYMNSNSFRVGMGYELFANNTLDNQIEWEHRMMLQSVFQYQYNRFQFSWRASLMDTFCSMSDPNFGMRNRLKIDYAITNIDFKPFVYTELYHGFDHGIFHQKNRYGLGMSYCFLQSQQLDLYYMIEDYATKSFTRHVIGLGYSYSFSL